MNFHEDMHNLQQQNTTQRCITISATEATERDHYTNVLNFMFMKKDKGKLNECKISMLEKC